MRIGVVIFCVFCPQMGFMRATHENYYVKQFNCNVLKMFSCFLFFNLLLSVHQIDKLKKIEQNNFCFNLLL